MLNQLLELLRSGGTHRVADLAHRLDTTPELVEAMLEDLGRMGYIERLNQECPGSCQTCPVAGLCAAGSSGHLWALTEKGASGDGVGGV